MWLLWHSQQKGVDWGKLSCQAHAGARSIIQERSARYICLAWQHSQSGGQLQMKLQAKVCSLRQAPPQQCIDK